MPSRRDCRADQDLQGVLKDIRIYLKAASCVSSPCISFSVGCDLGSADIHGCKKAALFDAQRQSEHSEILWKTLLFNTMPTKEQREATPDDKSLSQSRERLLGDSSRADEGGRPPQHKAISVLWLRCLGPDFSIVLPASMCEEMLQTFSRR